MKKFTVKLAKKDFMWTATGKYKDQFGDEREYEISGPSVHATLRGVAHLAESVASQRKQSYEMVICNDR